MIGMDDLIVSLHGESTAIGVAYDCEFERKSCRGTDKLTAADR